LVTQTTIETILATLLISPYVRPFFIEKSTDNSGQIFKLITKFTLPNKLDLHTYWLIVTPDKQLVLRQRRNCHDPRFLMQGYKKQSVIGTGSWRFTHILPRPSFNTLAYGRSEKVMVLERIYENYFETQIAKK